MVSLAGQSSQAPRERKHHWKQSFKVWAETDPASLLPTHSQRDGQETCFSMWMDRCLVAKLCLTRCESIEAQGISQIRILEWVAIFS